MDQKQAGRDQECVGMLFSIKIRSDIVNIS